MTNTDEIPKALKISKKIIEDELPKALKPKDEEMENELSQALEINKEETEDELPKALRTDNKEDIVKDKKAKKLKIWQKIIITIVILGIIGVVTLAVLLYGPYNGFRDWLITSAMTTMSHQYLATWFYDDETIAEVMNRNKVEETNEITDTSLTVIIDPEEEEEIEYENEYERQILEKNPGNEDYKIIEITGKGYSGYLAVIYDPSRIKTVYTKKLGTSGQYLTTMAKDNDALIAING